MMQLTEKDAEELLEKEGFDVAKRAFVKRKSYLDKISKQIKFPWVMKVSSSKIVHKAKIGGVKLNIQNLNEALSAFDELAKIKGFEGALIQEMIAGSELIIGLKKTPEFSHVLMFGKGGLNVEKEKEVVFRVLPLTMRDIEDMIEETGLKDKVDFAKIKKIIGQVEGLANKYNNISEFEINPLFVNEKEAVVADARFLFED